jgi:RluA family pseudouridine synthase
MVAEASVVFSDETIVAIAKPAGISLATRRRDPGAAIVRLLAALPAAELALHGLAADQLWLVHRLDVPTSGLVLLARDPESHRALVAAFSARRVEKRYLAMVWGRPRPRVGRWEWSLGPDRRDRRRMGVDPAGSHAASAYTVMGTGRYVSLLELAPETGRTHQLRVHCAAAGHPIVGDDLYGGPRERAVREASLRAALAPGRALLHAWRLTLPPPFGLDGLVLTAAPPGDLVAVAAAAGIAFPTA